MNITTPTDEIRNAVETVIQRRNIVAALLGQNVTGAQADDMRKSRQETAAGDGKAAAAPPPGHRRLRREGAA